MNMIRKGQVKGLPKSDIAGQAAFVGTTLWADNGLIADQLRPLQPLLSRMQHCRPPVKLRDSAVLFGAQQLYQGGLREKGSRDL